MKCEICGADISKDKNICDECYNELSEGEELVYRAIEEYEWKLPSVWAEYNIIENEDGRCIVEASTNDNNDDGYPDEEIVQWKMKFSSLERALSITGKSRTGCIGTVVTVWHNGTKI